MISYRPALSWYETKEYKMLKQGRSCGTRKIKKKCVCENSMIAQPSVAIYQMTLSHYRCGMRVPFVNLQFIWCICKAWDINIQNDFRDPIQHKSLLWYEDKAYCCILIIWWMVVSNDRRLQIYLIMVISVNFHPSVWPPADTDAPKLTWACNVWLVVFCIF